MSITPLTKLETNTQTIERLTRERDAALAACAEMREALFDITIQDCLLSHPDGCECCLEHASIKTIAQEGLNATDRGRGWLSPEKRKVVVEALAPFAACDPIKFGAIPDSETWLWKPQSADEDLPGINLAHILAAKQALDLVKEEK